MKSVMSFMLMMSSMAMATTMMNCPYGTFRTWSIDRGVQCVPQMQRPLIDPAFCGFPSPITNPFQHFPGPIYQPNPGPWWATQGNLHYPNVSFPGPWSYPYIQSQHYPGSGGVFAAKPNVYLETIYPDKKFEMEFVSEKKLSFLVTTPPLLNKKWKGRFVGTDKFEVDDIIYDYLFYDIRLPEDQMQYEAGGCATREDAIELMVQDLKDLRFSATAIQDFKEHWMVKIPNYPFYCIYPQYTEQLDKVLPVKFSTQQTSFTRVLYLLFPHKTAPTNEDPGPLTLPTKDPGTIRPDSKIKHEIMFKEWGVAFLGQ